MKVLVCGSRYWSDHESIRRELEILTDLHDDLCIVHGDARGADRIAGSIAKSLGLDVRAYPAEWSKFGNAAGPLRNSLMLKEEDPDLVLAFCKNLSESRGTRDMVTKSRKVSKPVRVIGE